MRASWTVLLAFCWCLRLAAAQTDCVGPIANLIDPAKLATLGERGANPRVQKCVYWLAVGPVRRARPRRGSWMDILVPRRTYEWDIVEVKSTTSVKEVHLHDLAFQAWVLTSAGHRIQRCSILHVNLDFVRRGPIDPKQFFIRQDLKEPVFQRTRSIDDQLAELFQVIPQQAHPDVKIGPHCDDPYTCGNAALFNRRFHKTSRPSVNGCFHIHLPSHEWSSLRDPQLLALKVIAEMPTP